MPRGPYTSRGASRPFMDMLCTMPGSPRKWSPWKWDTKTRETCMKLNLLSMNCRWVPSPQSNRMTSGPRLIATALTFRFGVGHDPDVPRNTTCMDPFLKGRRPLTSLDSVPSEGRCRVPDQSGPRRKPPTSRCLRVLGGRVGRGTWMHAGTRPAGRRRHGFPIPRPFASGWRSRTGQLSPETPRPGRPMDGVRRWRERATHPRPVQSRVPRGGDAVSPPRRSDNGRRSLSREPDGEKDGGAVNEDPRSKPSKPRPRRGIGPRRLREDSRVPFRRHGTIPQDGRNDKGSPGTPRHNYIAESGCRAGSCMRSIDGRSLDLEDVIAVARKGEPVRLAPAAATRVDASRRALEKVVAKGSLAYGVKTGFGELANVAISDADVRALQLNLLRSHAIGLGPPLRRDEVRAALLLRANTLAMGYSGVRRILVTRLLDFLNRGVHPVIPSRGSLGASGDLAPLAHLGLVLVGEGEAEVAGQILPGAKALAKANLAPLVLQSKEGLAIINGTSVMAGGGAILVNDGLRLAKDAQGAASMALAHVALGMAVLAGFSERRIARLVDTRLSELPPFLTEKSGLNSGMMIVQYVAAGYASDNKVLAHPASADSIPTSANQEDFVPMGMAAALKARQSLENAARVVALEVLAAAQGLEFLKPLRPGVGPRAVHAFVRSGVPPLAGDRSLSPAADRLLEWMETGGLLKAGGGPAGRLA